LLPTIKARRSARSYSSEPIAMEELSALCAAADGAAGTRKITDPLLAGSAPLSLFAVVRSVKGLDAGVYQYVPVSHALRRVKRGDFSKACMEACLEQEFCGTAAVVFVKTVRWSNLLYPDGDRGYRYANLRAGVVGEGLYLQATALGLGVCGVGAFMDPNVASLLDLRAGEEVPLYVTAVGKKKSLPKPPPSAVNLDFERGRKGEVPNGWVFPPRCAAQGYRACLSDDKPYQGRFCALLEGKGSAFGNIMQSFDATPYRGKHIRFKAAVRTEIHGKDNWAGLWMRVDLKDGGMGFFDNMQDRPITSGEWKVYTIDGDVDPEAEAINIGVLMAGSGRVWIDAASVEVVGAAPSTP